MTSVANRKFRAAFAAGTGLALTMALAAPSAVAVAAEARDDMSAANAVADDGANRDIIVTGLKRSQALQDVPAAITAFDSQMLESRQLVTSEDIATLVPSLNYTELNGVNIITIRGIAPDANNPSVDPSVAQHIDGVYQPRATNMNLALADLDSIEVLRGPQGTLYGRNSTAGVMNFNLKKPTDRFEGRAALTIGNYSRIKGDASISGPIAEGLSARLSATGERRDGYGTNLFYNEDIDNLRTYGVRGAIRYAGGPVEINLSAYHVTAKSNGPTPYPFTPLQGPDIERFAPQSKLLTTEPRKLYADKRGYSVNKQDGVTGTINLDVADNVSLKSITGYIRSTYRSEFDTEPTAAPIAVAYYNFGSKFFSQEFNVNANIADRADVVLGAYYARENFRQNPDVLFPNGLTSGGNLLPPVLVVNRADQIAKTRALFADATVNVTDNLRLLGGIRYTRDTKDVVQFNSFYATTCNNVAMRLAYSSTKGKIGVQYDINDDVMVYAQYQTGFKAGGFNIAACRDDFDPENVISREIGMKAQLLDRALTLNISAFDMDAKGLQVTKLVNIDGLPTNRVENAANARIRGFELESLARLGSAFSIDVNMSYLDAVYQDYESINTMTGVNVVLDGYQITRAPKFTTNVGATLKFSAGDIDARLRGEVYHSGKMWYTPFHEVIAAQTKSFTLVNAYLDLMPADSTLKLSLYGKNLTGEDYRTGANTSSQFRNGRGFWNDPRTFGAQVAVTF